jgi:hypothetical protein
MASATSIRLPSVRYGPRCRPVMSAFAPPHSAPSPILSRNIFSRQTVMLSFRARTLVGRASILCSKDRLHGRALFPGHQELSSFSELAFLRRSILHNERSFKRWRSGKKGAPQRATKAFARPQDNEGNVSQKVRFTKYVDSE